MLDWDEGDEAAGPAPLFTTICSRRWALPTGLVGRAFNVNGCRRELACCCWCCCHCWWLSLSAKPVGRSLSASTVLNRWLSTTLSGCSYNNGFPSAAKLSIKFKSDAEMARFSVL